MKALVTGGGGFLGSYLVERLIQRGDHVCVLGRHSYPQLETLGCQCIQGDIRDRSAVTKAVAGVDAVFHVAALAGIWGRWRDFYDINVLGTENVVMACQEHRVPKLVYTSTPSVIFGMENLEGVDESYPYPQKFFSYYSHTKAMAEQYVLAANGLHDVAVCALRPHLIWGPRDNHIIPMLILRARAHRLIQVGDGRNRVDITYIDNAVHAHLLAVDKLSRSSPLAGKAYFIGDHEAVNLWDWINTLLSQVGISGIKKSMSFKTAYRLGAILELLYRALPLPGEPRMTCFVAGQFALSHYFNMANARRDLGYHPLVTNDEGLERTVRWIKSTLMS